MAAGADVHARTPLGTQAQAPCAPLSRHRPAEGDGAIRSPRAPCCSPHLLPPASTRPAHGPPARSRSGHARARCACPGPPPAALCAPSLAARGTARAIAQRAAGRPRGPAGVWGAGRTARDWAEYNNASAAAALLRHAGVARTDGGLRPEAELARWAQERRERRRMRAERGHARARRALRAARPGGMAQSGQAGPDGLAASGEGRTVRGGARGRRWCGRGDVLALALPHPRAQRRKLSAACCQPVISLRCRPRCGHGAPLPGSCAPLGVSHLASLTPRARVRARLRAGTRRCEPRRFRRPSLVWRATRLRAGHTGRPVLACAAPADTGPAYPRSGPAAGPARPAAL